MFKYIIYNRIHKPYSILSIQKTVVVEALLAYAAILQKAQQQATVNTRVWLLDGVVTKSFHSRLFFSPLGIISVRGTGSARVSFLQTTYPYILYTTC